MAQIVTEGIQFDFPAALRLLKFDQQDKNKPDYHTLHAEMKCVDVVAEFADKDVYVEVKDFQNRLTGEEVTPDLARLLENLKYKYRDSFLYRYGQDKADNPILYICLMEHLDRRLLMQLQKRLNQNIPAGIIAGWTREILREVIVVDKKSWNENLSNMGTVS